MIEDKQLHRRHFLKLTAGVISFPYVMKGVQNDSINTEINRQKLVNWILSGYKPDEICLLANTPLCPPKKQLENKRIYWLQSCNLHATHVLKPYNKAISIQIETCYKKVYDTYFSELNEKTDHYLAMGILPDFVPPKGKFPKAIAKFRMINNHHIGTESHDKNLLGTIKEQNSKILFKHGVLRSVLLDQIKDANQYFDMGMALWDGHGFKEKRSSGTKYKTKSLVYSLIAANALKRQLPEKIHKAIERHLWNCQDKDGGLWTEYTEKGVSENARKNNELAPLTLLAYDHKIWS